jgi:hypothetical protein
VSYGGALGNTLLQSGLTTNTTNSWTSPPGITIQPSDFLSVDSTGVTGARQADGSLPDLDFLKLSPTSQAIDKGTDVGIAYEVLPDLGPYEWADYPAEPSIPSISTRYPSLINTSTISTGGFMIADGGSSITAKGVCYNTTGAPDITDNLVSGGIGVDDYNVTIEDLLPNVTYYICAYATNSEGTGYGSTYSITTDKWNYLYHGGKIVTHNGKPVIIR